MQTWKNQTIGAYKKTNDEILSQALEDGYLLVDGDETVLKLNLTSEDGRKVLCDDDRVPLAQSKHQEQVTFFGMITSDGVSFRPVVVRKRTSGIHFEHYVQTKVRDNIEEYRFVPGISYDTIGGKIALYRQNDDRNSTHFT